MFGDFSVETNLILNVIAFGVIGTSLLSIIEQCESDSIGIDETLPRLILALFGFLATRLILYVDFVFDFVDFL